MHMTSKWNRAALLLANFLLFALLLHFCLSVLKPYGDVVVLLSIAISAGFWNFLVDVIRDRFPR
jgi:hypothetical protein